MNTLKKATIEGRYSSRLSSKNFDLVKLSEALVEERNDLFNFVGLQILVDRYLIKGSRWIELPQVFFMRVAMGLALAETTREQKTERAIEFYNLMSTFKYIPSTPTLFNSGTNHMQMSSCYISTTKDDLGDMFNVMSENAHLQKYAGGIGNDWNQIRCAGSHIAGTHGASSGLVPFLKIVNDIAIAVNQGGKRKGAACCYIENWHADVSDFIDLREVDGDHRRQNS